MASSQLPVIEAHGLRYLLSVPPDAGRVDGGWALLCFLHGYDEGAPTDIHEALTRHGPLRPGSACRAVEQFVVVAPQLPARGDTWHQYADRLRSVVGDVRQMHRVDPERCYLTGFSYGGNGVFDLAIEQPDPWAALWAVDPTRVPREVPRLPAWVSIGAAARPGRDRFIRALALESAERDLEGKDRLYLDQGEDHTGSARRAYADDRIYRWLLSKRHPHPATNI